MELRSLLFLVCLPAFITGTDSKETIHDFNSTLRDNIKKYFKSYTLGNFKDVHEKQLSALKIKKWVGEHVSRRAKMTRMVTTPDETRVLIGIPARDVFSKMTRQKNTYRGINIQDLLNGKLLGSTVGKGDNSNEENTNNLVWFYKAAELRQKISSDIDSFFKSWSDILNALPNRCDKSPEISMSAHHADTYLLGVTPTFMNLFWPFRFDINIMNQRLAATGLTNKMINENNETLKLDFFKELQDLQGIRLPVRGNQIVLSFGDEDVLHGLNRSTLVSLSKHTKAGKHLYSEDEQTQIRLMANKALDLINKTHAELYNTMVQMVSCIAFFKDKAANHMSGSVNSAIGLIWLDPREDWTVPLMAEQILHEFIHTSLFYAELVHGGYKDASRLPEVKAMSSIRHEPRPYDKSLHAAYVSAGLITFNTRAGFYDRAIDLARTMPEAVQELNRVNAETDVLDEAGRAMLNFLTDYVCLTHM